LLLKLKLSDEWRDSTIKTIGTFIGNQHLEARMNEIKRIIERMDMRWDMGFITDKVSYMEQRIRLQQEVDALEPIPGDEMARAADIVDHFPQHWQAVASDKKAQHELIKLIVERVYVDGNAVVGLVLKSGYSLTLNTEE